MLIPLLLPRGHSLDTSTWTEWFSRSYQQHSLKVYLHYLDENLTTAEVKVELSMLGVPVIRALFSWAHPEKPEAGTWIRQEMFWLVREQIEALFDVEYRAKSAPVFSGARQYGLSFLNPIQTLDVNDYYYEHMAKLEIQLQHVRGNKEGVPTFSPERHSAFDETLTALEDFEGEIDDE